MRLPWTTHIKNSETGDWLDFLVASKIGVLFNNNFHRDMVIWSLSNGFSHRWVETTRADEQRTRSGIEWS